MRDYRKIEAWQLADDLAVAIYRLSNGLPREEIYGLTSQMRRSAVSVAANIVEGSARETKGDYLHFLHIARGSLAETQYFIHLTRRLEFVPEPDANVWRNSAAGRMPASTALSRRWKKTLESPTV